MKLNQLWEDVKEILEGEFSKETYEKWIYPLEFDEASEGDELILTAPISMSCPELKKYQSYIDNTIYYSFGVYKIVTIQMK